MNYPIIVPMTLVLTGPNNLVLRDSEGNEFDTYPTPSDFDALQHFAVTFKHRPMEETTTTMKETRTAKKETMTAETTATCCLYAQTTAGLFCVKKC